MASLRLSPQRDVDMTKGNITSHIIRFALPLLVGNLFQQLYNTIDIWVVGNYVSNEAFSAVGAVAPIVNMLIGSFTGLASGAGVVISQYYGAGRKDKVEDTVHTALLMTLVLSVLFTAFGLFVSPHMLRFMDLHEGAVDDANTYLTIYFSGMIGLMFYNIGAGILRAIGDSKRPFYFLVVCAVLNTILDLVFVLVLHMGVVGVALATIISQLVSAVLIIIVLLQTNTCVKLILRKLKFHWPILRKILIVGIPAALQMAVTAFSNVFVQSYITHFDLGAPSPDYMSGWTAYLKIDQLLFLPMQSVSLAVTTFVGQNLGSNQVERAKQGVRRAVILSLSATAIMMIPVLVFAPDIVGFLNDKPEVISNGTLFLRLLTPFYLLCCFNQIYAGALRGSGNSRIPMVIMLSSFVLFRQLYLFGMSRICNEVVPIALSYPAGWLLCSILTGLYYRKATLTKTRLVEDSQ
ncbi:MAG: MATE family efflux transporter [Oscillospiraceae bacterium]|nr:MATE family efflux transporter [Oscillospiraceae bacterium]